jgi:hypothetical protein
LEPGKFQPDDDGDRPYPTTVFSGITTFGAYTVSEADPTPAFDLTGLTCSLVGTGSTSTDLGTRTATIDLQEGDSATCTFTNTKRGTIIVEKQTNPDGAAGSFTFTGTAAGTISDNGQIAVANLVPGTYTSTETDPSPNFALTSIVCDDGSSATPSTGDVGHARRHSISIRETVK